MGPEYECVSSHETDAALDDNKHGQAKKSKFDPPRRSNISTSSEEFFHLDPKLLPRLNDHNTSPEYESVSRYEIDAALNDDDNDKHGQAKKSKVDPPRISNISTASSEDFFHLDPKLLPRLNDPKILQENGQKPPHRYDQVELTRDISFKSEDQDVWSQSGTSPISDVTHEAMLQNMSPTQSPPVQVMERHKDDNSKYDPNRIPASAFINTSSTPVEWSTASNDSLFSIRLGNNSMSRDHCVHTRKVHGDLLHKHEDLHKAGDPLKFKKPFPAMERKSDCKKLELENKSESYEPQTNIPKETVEKREVKFSPIEITFTSPAPIRRSNGSELDAQDFVAPIKKSGCTMCNCTNCRMTMCACTWPSCCHCCSCKWLSCSSCKWPNCCSCKSPSCCSCKWPSCSSCKWPSCCSCKWPSCNSCKWPNCCSCKWPNCCSCKWPSCSSCEWPSCCSCKWPNCCSCKWPSCSSCKWPNCCSCGWPSCPKCSLKCFECPNCSCGFPSCSSCSFKCFRWPSCNCFSCSWPSICCWKCKPKKIFCCFSKVMGDDKISDRHKRAPNKRSRCCHFPSFSWSWFTCRCC